MSEPRSIGFIGVGMMAGALIKGIAAAGLVPLSAMSGYDANEYGRNKAGELGVRVASSNADLAATSDVIFLAVKPYVVPEVLAEIKASLKPTTLIVSIAAGVTLASIEAIVPGAKVVRVMPNTPCSVGMSASGYSCGAKATGEDMAYVGSIMNSVGVAVAVGEKDLNAVTGVSGSGPAYIFMLIEALSDGGVRCGLPRDVATMLAAQTVKGSAEMVLATGMHPGALKDQVTSPGGTTIAAVEALEKGNFRATAMSAVVAAKARADELGKL